MSIGSGSIPSVVGNGKRLFKDGIDTTGLKLLATKTTRTGVVILSHQPAETAAEASVPDQQQ